MLRDLDDSLEELFRRELREAKGADPQRPMGVSFAPPDDSFPPDGVELPVANLFLYDIRENRELGVGDRTRYQRWEEDGRARRRLLPEEHRWINASYLITAWVGGPRATSDEHFWLGLMLAVVLRYPVLPAAVLKGKLKTLELPVRLLPIQSEGMQSMGDFWRAMGGKPKAALGVTATFAAALSPERSPAPKPVEVRDLSFDMKRESEGSAQAKASPPATSQQQ